MQFPESWLRQFCNPSLSTEQLADTLTMAGLEVEELRPVAPPFTKMPWRAAVANPLTIVTGVEMTRAQGQAMTSSTNAR